MMHLATASPLLAASFILTSTLFHTAAATSPAFRVQWAAGNSTWKGSASWSPQHEPCADEAVHLLGSGPTLVTLEGSARAARVYFSNPEAGITFAAEGAYLSATNTTDAQAECMRLAPTSKLSASGVAHVSWNNVAAVYEISYNGKTVASALKVSAANVSLVGEEDNHNFTVTATRADGRQSSATLQARHDVLSRKVTWRSAVDGDFKDASKWDANSVPCASSVILPPSPKSATSAYIVSLDAAVPLLAIVFSGGYLAFTEPDALVVFRTEAAPISCEVSTTAAPPTTPIPASPFTVEPDTATSIRITWPLGSVPLDSTTEISARNLQSSLVTRTTVPASVNATAMVIHGLIAGDVYEVAVADAIVARTTMPLARLNWASAESGNFDSTVLWTRQGAPVSRAPCPSEHLLLSATVTSPVSISVTTKAASRSLTFSAEFPRIVIASLAAQLSLTSHKVAESDAGEACWQPRTTTTTTTHTTTTVATTTTPALSTLRGTFAVGISAANVTVAQATQAIQTSLTAAVTAANGMELPAGLSLVPADVTILAEPSDPSRRRAEGASSVSVTYTLAMAFEHHELVFCAMRSIGSPGGREGALAVALAAETGLTAPVSDTVVTGCDACRCFYAPLPCPEGLVRKGGRCRTTDVSCPTELFLLSSGACQDISTGVISKPSCADYPETRVLLLSSGMYVCDTSATCNNSDLVYSAPDEACRFRVTPDCPAEHVINAFGLCVPATVLCPAGSVYDPDELRPGSDSPLLDGCFDINECAAAVAPCVSDATCLNTDNGFTCACPAGSGGDGRVNGTGCHTYCNTQPCLNGGTCVVGRDSYACRCLDGFAGTDCETPTPCMTPEGLCSGHGTCENEACACTPGYEGAYCAVAVACEDDPCANGGTCAPDASGSGAACTCSAGFAGPTCTIDLAACFIVLSPCSERGVCVPAASGGFSCTCNAGVGGERCNTTLPSDTPGTAAGSSASAAAAAAGATAGAVVLVAVVLLILRRRRRHRRMYKTSTGALWEVDRRQLRMGAKLGTGAFGDVYAGWLKTSRSSRGGGRERLCAVKMVSSGASQEQEAEFRTEVQLMCLLGDGHAHVVGFVGYCMRERPLLLLLEICEQGNLRDHLRAHVLPMAQVSITPAVLDSLLKYACETASGMAYLAQRGIVHRDLSARNVLLTKNNVVKIADFGLAREIQDKIYATAAAYQLPIRWMAPELLGAIRSYTFQSDVWSFGVTCYEIFSCGERPYASVTTEKEVMRLVRAGERLPQSALCPRPVYAIMSDTWAMEPAGRPSFAVLVERLDALRKLGGRHLFAALPKDVAGLSGDAHGTTPGGSARTGDEAAALVLDPKYSSVNNAARPALGTQSRSHAFINPAYNVFYAEVEDPAPVSGSNPLYHEVSDNVEADSLYDDAGYLECDDGTGGGIAETILSAASPAHNDEVGFGFFGEPSHMLDMQADNLYGDYEEPLPVASPADYHASLTASGVVPDESAKYYASLIVPGAIADDKNTISSPPMLSHRRGNEYAKVTYEPSSPRAQETGASSGPVPGYNRLGNRPTRPQHSAYDTPRAEPRGTRPFDHGDLSRQDAEAVLLASGCGPGGFLLRNSSSSKPGDRALSVCTGSSILHHLVGPTPDGWVVNGKLAMPPATSIEGLLTCLHQPDCGGGVLVEPLGSPVEVQESFEA